MTFQEFKQTFMGDFKGYVPSFIVVGKDEENGDIIASVDMIAPVSSKRNQFQFKVTKNEAHEIAVWARQAGDWWKTEMDKTAAEIIRSTDTYHELVPN